MNDHYVSINKDTVLCVGLLVLFLCALIVALKISCSQKKKRIIELMKTLKDNLVHCHQCGHTTLKIEEYSVGRGKPVVGQKWPFDFVLTCHRCGYSTKFRYWEYPPLGGFYFQRFGKKRNQINEVDEPLHLRV